MLRLLTVRLLTRVWLLAGSLSLISLLILGRCGIQENTYITGTKSEPVVNTAYVTLLEQREEENRAEVMRLTEEIRSLKLQILQLTSQENGYQVHHVDPNFNITDCTSYIRQQIASSELLHGSPLNNEYELISFNHFTFNRIYPIDLGLGKRVVEKPIGYKRKDLVEVIMLALDTLNRNITDKKTKHNFEDFLEGIYRIEPTTGTEYELYFKTKSNKNQGIRKLTVMRPFSPLVLLSQTFIPQTKDKELIHIILPLSGRISTFQSFMDKFVKIGLKNDKRVILTVVYFGEEGLSEARLIMSKVAGKNNHGNNLRLLALNETFSRGKGLKVGAERPWEDTGVPAESQDALLFMCDVDIVFSARFLDRCRWNAKAGKKVYYPVVFSLYNPHVVYTLQGKKVPSETDQLVISRDTGFWRDFGYGMTCQYKSDFLRVRGFDEDITGWGLEDVMLYRKYVRSHIKVVRATDPGIFHIWHPKVCTGDQQMSADQYRACIRSRALNEASHAQLGFLAFRDDIVINHKQQNVQHIKTTQNKKPNQNNNQNTLKNSKHKNFVIVNNSNKKSIVNNVVKNSHLTSDDINQNNYYDKNNKNFDNDISNNNNNNNLKGGDPTMINSDLLKTKNRSLKQNWLRSVKSGRHVASNTENKDILTSSLKEET